MPQPDTMTRKSCKRTAGRPVTGPKVICEGAHPLEKEAHIIRPPNVLQDPYYTNPPRKGALWFICCTQQMVELGAFERI